MINAREEAETAAEAAREIIEQHTEYETRQRHTVDGEVEQYRAVVDRPHPEVTAAYVADAYRTGYRVEERKRDVGHAPGWGAIIITVPVAVVRINSVYSIEIEDNQATAVEAGDGE